MDGCVDKWMCFGWEREKEGGGGGQCVYVYVYTSMYTSGCGLKSQVGVDEIQIEVDVWVGVWMSKQSLG